MKKTMIVTIKGTTKEVKEQFALIASDLGTKVYEAEYRRSISFDGVTYRYEKGREIIVKGK